MSNKHITPPTHLPLPLFTLQVKLPDGSSALSKARYLSSTSGGSWCNAAFSFKVCACVL